MEVYRSREYLWRRLVSVRENSCSGIWLRGVEELWRSSVSYCTRRYGVRQTSRTHSKDKRAWGATGVRCMQRRLRHWAALSERPSLRAHCLHSTGEEKKKRHERWKCWWKIWKNKQRRINGPVAHLPAFKTSQGKTHVNVTVSEHTAQPLAGTVPSLLAII